MSSWFVQGVSSHFNPTPPHPTALSGQVQNKDVNTSNLSGGRLVFIGRTWFSSPDLHRPATTCKSSPLETVAVFLIAAQCFWLAAPTDFELLIADLVKKLEDQKAEAERQLKVLSRQIKVREPGRVMTSESYLLAARGEKYRMDVQ